MFSITLISVGTMGTSRNLINDLDLHVTDGTQRWEPMVTNIEELGRKYDIKNNLEFIYLDSLTPNTNYTVVVTARSISRTQPYALVLNGEIEHYSYTDSNSGVASGLSRTAKILVIIACCVTFCFTGLVLYIGFVNPRRRTRINNAKEILKILENVLNYDDDDEDEEEEQG